ncbi:MAG: DUF3526 domain-containing protein [Pseudomonadota bacterium]
MDTVWRIAVEEWRYWRRTRLFLGASAVVLVMLIVALANTSARMTAADHSRAHLQQTASEAFEAQPDRHPHRMVHYGHYVFREPAPLAILDPGVDPYAGTVMFLEGHHQNSATFSPAYSAPRAGPLASLTPAALYQQLVPLLLIVVGFSMLTREQEQRTDRLLLTSAVSPATLWAGKALALTGFALLLLLPLALGAVYAVTRGASVTGAALFLGGYALYLCVWALLTTAASAWCRQGAAALTLLLLLWLGLSVVMPPAVSAVASAVHPMASKIESDLAVQAALADLGDGHNAADPSFAKLRSQLLAQYDVDRVEDLPINFRGVVAGESEAELTAIMNRFARGRMAREREQAATVDRLSLLSPQLVLQRLSSPVAGSDLAQHHAFAEQAEAVRFEFVQGLNDLHANELDYALDINRNADTEAAQRARISASNWSDVLADFRFEPVARDQLTGLAALPLLGLLLWCALAIAAGLLGVRRNAGSAHG